MPNVGPTELIIVLVLALLILGPKRLPGVGRSLGSGLREFKESVTGATAVSAPLGSERGREDQAQGGAG